jgi:hypothetical protein
MVPIDWILGDSKDLETRIEVVLKRTHIWLAKKKGEASKSQPRGRKRKGE